MYYKNRKNIYCNYKKIEIYFIYQLFNINLSIMETHKLLSSISFTLYMSKYYIDNEYNSDDEETLTRINMFGYIIKEYDRYNYLTLFNYENKVFCCVIPINKCNKNNQTKKIPNHIYDKLIINYLLIDENIILEFKSSRHFIENVSDKKYSKEKSTYSNRVTYYV